MSVLTKCHLPYGVKNFLIFYVSVHILLHPALLCVYHYILRGGKYVAGMRNNINILGTW